MGLARLVGINHIALEVGDVDQALDFYGRRAAISAMGLDGLGRIERAKAAELRRQRAEDH